MKMLAIFFLLMRDALVSFPLFFDRLVALLCSPSIVREKDDDETSPFRLSGMSLPFFADFKPSTCPNLRGSLPHDCSASNQPAGTMRLALAKDGKRMNNARPVSPYFLAIFAKSGRFGKLVP